MKNYKKTCRICLTSSSSQVLMSIFQGNYTDYIHELTGIQIDKQVTGKIPTNICVTCSEALTTANEIRKMCLSSEEYLRHLIGGSKSDEILGYDFSSSTFPMDIQPIVKIEIIKEESVGDCSTGFEMIDDLSYNDPITPKDFLVSTMETDIKSTQKIQQAKASNMVQCQKCGKLYNSRYLQKHINSHDKPIIPPDKLKSYRCDICDYFCNVKAYMTSHMNAQHVVNKKYQCEFCSRSFTKLYKLRDHVYTHTGEKMYVCSVPDCGKRFHAPKNLKSHTRVHNNDARYNCKFCDRKFIQFIDHKRHELSHSGQKLYNCSFANCGRGFMKKADLTRHIDIHHLTI